MPPRSFSPLARVRVTSTQADGGVDFSPFFFFLFKAKIGLRAFP